MAVEAGFWTILEDRYRDNLNEVAEQIVREGAENIRTRDDLRFALVGIEGFEGVTGPMAFDSERRAQRNPLLLTISGKHFLPLP